MSSETDKFMEIISIAIRKEQMFRLVAILFYWLML